ncbi:MAG: SoxR reducing system RseC family protein [Clostridiaceae bacterium]|nr:SoxR reducing system RseC family protein [Clostridiaceae bacterium]
MRQIGLVCEVDKDMAKVQIKRATACGGKCGECNGCETTSQQVIALNTVGAKVGEIVQMEMDDGKVLFAAFLVYGMPLILLFIGYAIGYFLWSSELAGGLIGSMMMIGSFFVIKKMDKGFARKGKYTIVITKILS